MSSISKQISPKYNKKIKKKKEEIILPNNLDQSDQFDINNDENHSDKLINPNFPIIDTYSQTHYLKGEQPEIEEWERTNKKNRDLETITISGKEQSEMTSTFSEINKNEKSLKNESSDLEENKYISDNQTKEYYNEEWSDIFSDRRTDNNYEYDRKESKRTEGLDSMSFETDKTDVKKIVSNVNVSSVKKKKKQTILTTNRNTSETNKCDRLEQLKNILNEQLKKKNMKLNEKLRKKQSERSKLEIDLNRIGLELYRINKECENLEKREQELMKSLEHLNERKENYINGKKELEDSYNKDLSNYKKELNYYAELYNKYNKNLLEKKNLKNYYDFLNSSSKISEIALSSDKMGQTKENKINKKENIIDKLNYKINKTQNDINVNEELLKSEEIQNENLENSLKEEKKELTALKKEQKKIVEKINDSINQMKKRNTIINEINSKMDELKKRITDLEKENEHMEEETVVGNEKKDKLISDLKYIEKEIKKINKKKNEVNKNILDITKNNEQLKADICKEKEEHNKICDEIKNINKDIEHKEKTIDTVKQDINKSIDSILNIYINEIKINTFSARIKKDLSAVKESITIKETELENYKNAIIRMTIQEILENTKIVNIKERLNKLTNIYNENSNMLSHLETIISKNHYLIENKQVDVDRLNKEFDKKNKKNDDINNQPLTLEIKVQKLHKQIDEKLKECRSLEKQWFLKQSELVKLQNENLKIHDEIFKNKDICVILNQKKCELQETLKNEQLIKKRKNKNVEYIRLQLEKFSSKTNETLEKIKLLEGDMLKWTENINIKTEAERKKKEQLKNEINELKKEKMQCQQDLLDYENKILILENKITEEKKLQELIKEYSENKDIINLRKQIQQKNITIDNLKKQQNGILANIKLALNKRNDLENKKDVVQNNYDSGVNISSKIQYEISLIKKSFVSHKSKKEQLCIKLNELKNKHEELMQEMEQQQICIDNLNEEYFIFDGIIKIQKSEKNQRFQELLKFQKAPKNLTFYENLKLSYDDIKEKCSNYKKKVSVIVNKLDELNNTNKNYIRCVSILKEWLLH